MLVLFFIMVFGGDGFEDDGMLDVPLVKLSEVGEEHYFKVRKSIGFGGFPEYFF